MLRDALEGITLADLDRLVNDQIPEGKTIEYKREFYRLDGDSPDFAKRQFEELLKDVSSFANTIGGDLLIGIAEENGLPTEVCGFEVDDIDALKLRLIQTVQSGLEPRLGIAIHAIPSGQGRAVLIIRVPRSLAGPHRVVFRKQFGQFWARNSAGAYSMDTGELRHAFTLSETVFAQIKAFREHRVSEIRRGQTPILLPSASKLVCHLIPLESYASRLSFDPAAFEHIMVHLPMLHATGGWSHRFNMDGMVTMDSADARAPSSGYVQIFRNGTIESVADDIVFFHPQDSQNQHPLFKTDYVQEVVQVLPQYLRALRTLGVPAPVWCYFTLIGVKGVSIYSQGAALRSGAPIDRDILFVSEIEVRDLAIGRCERLLKPIFDTIWNAAGFPRCPYFNADGDFTRGR